MPKYLLSLFLVLLLACFTSPVQLQKRIVQCGSHTYTLRMPVGSPTVTIGRYEEGHGFTIAYPDSSTIFINAVTGYSSPTSKYYESCARCFFTMDTLVSGVQPNGRLWKERFYAGKSRGYYNVPRAQQRLYDQALSSLRPRITASR